MDKIDIYLSFLRWCLSGKDASEAEAFIHDINWHELKKFAKKHNIVGLCWNGIQRGLKLQDIEVLDWMSSSIRIPKVNKRVFEQCVELTEYLKEKGFRSCILKGQGNSLLYPDVYSRNPGDIDIWIEGGRDKVIDFICKVSNPGEVVYHDIDFPYFEDIDVEAHFIPAYLENPFLNRKLQKYIASVADDQFSNQVEAPGGIGKFYMPTLEFNLLFQMLHLDKHLRTEGIGIRQLIDYYFLLKELDKSRKAGKTNCPTNEQIVHLFKEFKVHKFAKAVMYVLHNILGLEESYLITQTDEKEGKFLFDEMLKSGNFGQSDERLQKVRKTKGMSKFIELEKFKLRLISHYPSEVIWMPFHDLYVHYFYIKRYQKKYHLEGKKKKKTM